jgi:hypothetical protein
VIIPPIIILAQLSLEAINADFDELLSVEHCHRYRNRPWITIAAGR